jgi:hypothetical protein
VKSSYPNRKPRCPHCGSFALTEAEESVLAALYTAPTWPTLAQVAKVVGCSTRTVLRTVRALPSLVMAVEADRQLRLYQLTREGHRAVELLVGREAAA